MTTTPAAPALATTGMRGKEGDGSVEVEGEGAEVVAGGRAAEKEKEKERILAMKIPTILTYILAVLLG